VLKPGLIRRNALHFIMTNTATRQPTFRRTVFRLGVWARRTRVANVLAILLGMLALISGVATYAALSDWGQFEFGPRTVLVLLNIDLLLLLCFGLLIARRIVALWVAQRSGAKGSRLHVRLALLFGVVAITPAILMGIFAGLFFTFGLQSWFSERVRTALTESSAVAQAYLSEHQQIIRAEVLAMANDVNRQWPQLSRSPQVLNQFLSTQTTLRSLTEAVIFTSDWQVVAKAGYTFALQSGEVIPLQGIAQANLGQVAVMTGESADRVRALIRLDSFPGGGYLYVGRFVDPTVLGHLDRTQDAVDEYFKLEISRANLEISFSLFFILVALLLLLAAVWLGLLLASSLARPIMALIDASEKIRSGDLSVRVKEIPASDEIASLGRAFNRMTSRLDAQQTELLDTNAQLDERRRFTEAVLSGVTAGVVGLDPNGNITLPNRSASDLLGKDLTVGIGKAFFDYVPEFSHMLTAIKKTRRRQLQEEVHIRGDDGERVFLVRIVAERLNRKIVGYVFTFDDITELQSAQRKAAWADVARRIAHEIKNPLTPIQLSAERLKKKYMERIADDSGAFEKCTDTIVRHVHEIGQMVDEFSAFARMPEPVKRSENIQKIICDAAFLQRTAYPNIVFVLDSSLDEPTWVQCDARQIGQALTNLFKNAVESIERRRIREGSIHNGSKVGEVRVSIACAADSCTIEIRDNGAGLPQQDRYRLTEPYFTTRSRGTGLGLSIVEKIMGDHGGKLILQDADSGGARILLEFQMSDEDNSSLDYGIDASLIREDQT